VALAIVSLSDSTGRQDALTLAARGAALVTLGRSSEAVGPLRQALRLTPDLAAAKTQLRLAERTISAGAAKRAAAKPQNVGLPAAKPQSASSLLAGTSGGEVPAKPYSNEAPETRSN
jgi:hypothetical protein